MSQSHLLKKQNKKKTLQININKTHSNKQPNTTSEDEQQNSEKHLG